MASDAQQDRIETLTGALAQRDAALKIAHLTIDKLKLELSYLRRMQYGRSSEKLDHDGQLELMDSGMAPASAANDPAAPAVPPAADSSKKRSAKPRAGSRELPAHLPRQTIVHNPEGGCNCAACGSGLRVIGQDVSEVLDYEPGNFLVVRHVRPKLACGGCQSIVQAAAPSRPVDRALAGAGLMAHVLVSKYADHTPLYRQSQIYAREGVEMAVSTLSDIVGGAAWLLTPLAQAMGRYVLAGSKVHGDDTPIRVLGGQPTRPGPAGCGSMSVTTEPAATPRRRRCGFNTRQTAKANTPGATFDTSRASCRQTHSPATTASSTMGASWRRHAGATPGESSTTSTSSSSKLPGTLAHEALQRIAVIFAIEADIQGQLPEERRRQRELRTRPVLDELQRWLNATLAQVSAKSPMALAIGYTMSNWRALVRFVDDGRIEAHNNIAERALRGVAIGRKNYLHLGSDSGGERAAVIYSLLGTAKLNGLNPRAYLRHVLDRIAEHPINRIDELLPWAVAGQINADIAEQRLAA
jgi:transposase